MSIILSRVLLSSLSSDRHLPCEATGEPLEGATDVLLGRVSLALYERERPGIRTTVKIICASYSIKFLSRSCCCTATSCEGFLTLNGERGHSAVRQDVLIA